MRGLEESTFPCYTSPQLSVVLQIMKNYRLSLCYTTPPPQFNIHSATQLNQITPSLNRTLILREHQSTHVKCRFFPIPVSWGKVQKNATSPFLFGLNPKIAFFFKCKTIYHN